VTSATEPIFAGISAILDDLIGDAGGADGGARAGVGKTLARYRLVLTRTGRRRRRAGSARRARAWLAAP
jgi:hypothetical protein